MNLKPILSKKGSMIMGKKFGKTKYFDEEYAKVGIDSFDGIINIFAELTKKLKTLKKEAETLANEGDYKGVLQVMERADEEVYDHYDEASISWLYHFDTPMHDLRLAIELETTGRF